MSTSCRPGPLRGENTALFVPPDGAMQFEVTIGPDGKTLVESMNMWVLRGEKLNCASPLRPYDQTCAHQFVVLAAMEHEQLRASNFARAVRERKRIIVCDCIGRIIE